MPIPDYETLMLPLLQIAAEMNGQEIPLTAAVEKLATQFKLTTDERHELLPSGGTFKFSLKSFESSRDARRSAERIKSKFQLTAPPRRPLNHWQPNMNGCGKPLPRKFSKG
mgnify:CR=1 FL=1